MTDKSQPATMTNYERLCAIRDMRTHLESAMALANSLRDNSGVNYWRTDVYDHANKALKGIPALPAKGQLVPDVGAIVEPTEWSSVDGRTGGETALLQVAT